MKLKETAKQWILDNPNTSLVLAMELGVSQEWVRTLAKRNGKNGPLTTAAAVALLKRDMNVNDDSEVLEKESIEQAA